MNKLYSNEMVFRGHPDKVCDQISDSILDAYLSQDKNTRAGIEVVGGKGIIFITGEVSSAGTIDLKTTVNNCLSEIGYEPSKYAIIDNLGVQSTDISQGVIIGGAGDQGMMFGYACADTKEYLPVAQVILQKFSRKYDELRKLNDDLLPDGKCQITGLYDENFNLLEIDTFTLSYQNKEVNRTNTDLILKSIATNICNEYNIEIKKFLINPTGKFLIGGFEGDAGLTGRKIVVDSYHSFANVGGGAFSGKDGTKVDRSGTYKARQIAIECLQERELKWCEVQLSYAIGVKEPLAIYIDSDKGNIEPFTKLYKECIPQQIIEDLDLRKPIFCETAKFGHFGNNNFGWEK